MIETRRVRWDRWTIGLLAACVVACAGEPAPLAVRAGSTATLLYGSERYVSQNGNVVGYGSSALEEAGTFDDLRGQLVLTLTDPVLGDHELETRFVTRALVDPATEAGVANDATGNPFLEPLGLSQLIVVVNVPDDVPAGVYDVDVLRRRRIPPGPDTFEELTDVAPYPYTIEVLPGDPIAATASDLGAVTPAIPEHYPHPKLVVELPSPRPAAAQISIQYPAAKIDRPLAVFEEQNLGRDSVVAWSDSTPPGTVSISFADPDADVTQLALAFVLPDGPLDAAALPAAADFSVASETYYDADGNETPGSATLGPIR